MKLALVLHVTTIRVERARDQDHEEYTRQPNGDEFINDCLVAYITFSTRLRKKISCNTFKIYALLLKKFPPCLNC